MPDEAERPPLEDAERKVLEILFFSGPDEWWHIAELARGHRRPPRTVGEVDPVFSEGTARKGVKGLLEKGLVETRLQKANRQSKPSPSYRLRDAPDVAGRVAAAYLETLRATGQMRRAVALLRSDYATRALREGLVRYVLAEREAGCYLTLPMGEWPSFLPEGVDLASVHVLPHPIYFPVCPPHIAPEAFVKHLLESNRNLIEGNDKQLIEEAITKHYMSDEDRRLVWPIVALISVSHRALAAFLSPWEPHGAPRHRIRAPFHGAIEHVLYALIFAALYEISETRQLPGNVVSRAEANPPRPPEPGVPGPTLEVELYSGAKIQFAAGFRAPMLMVPSVEGLLLPPWENPAQAWAHISWIDAPLEEPDEDEHEEPEEGGDKEMGPTTP